jgi:hypothetical protein
MDTTSPPAVREETVTDLEFTFASGPQSFTLREGKDTVDFTDDQIVLTFGLPLGGQVFVYKPHILWFSTRTYVRKWPAKDEGKAQRPPSSRAPVRQAEAGPLDHS